jgi:hypothetical protein
MTLSLGLQRQGSSADHSFFFANSQKLLPTSIVIMPKTKVPSQICSARNTTTTIEEKTVARKSNISSIKNMPYSY